jgi:D-alanine--D-alanine ligase
MKIALICGGPSAERGISLNSARSVMDHLGDGRASDEGGVEIVPIYFDHKKNAYSVSTGQLYSNTPSDFDFKLQRTAKLLSKTALKNLLKSCDLAFPVMHGKFGEDGGVQRMLEEFKVPYVGSGVEACKRCFDKFEANEFIREKGFYTLPSAVLKIFHDDHEEIVRRFFKEHIVGREGVQRAVVKPATGGSSIGVVSVESVEEALEAVRRLFSKRVDTRVVIEPFCEGVEFTVIILQNRFGMPVAIMPTEMEMDYSENQVFDYRRKYLPSNQVRYHCPPRFDNKTIEKIQVQAEQLFTALGMRDFARFDGWLMPDGNLWFSDFNPISGMEQNSFLFQQTARVGFSHRDLLRFVVRQAARRQGLFVPGKNASGADGSKKNIRVVFGGDSSERQVSLMSGTNAWLKLRRSKKYEPRPYLLGLDGNVWELPYALTLNHTVEEILENCLSAEEDEERLAFLEEKVRLRLALEEGDLSEEFFLPRKMKLQKFIAEAAAGGLDGEGEFVFIGLHGGIGENGVLQGMLAKAGVKFNGSGEKTSDLCMDKFRTGEALAGMESEGIYSAPKLKARLVDFDLSFTDLQRELGTRTVIVKPVDEGCSSGIVRLTCDKDLQAYVRLAAKGVPFIKKGTFKNQTDIIEMPPCAMKEVLFEEFVEVDKVRVKGNDLKWRRKKGWVEVTTGVLESGGEYHAFAPSLTVAEGSVLSVEEKFQGGTGVNMTPPPEEYVSEEVLRKVRKSAEKVAARVGIEGYCRIDMFMQIDSGDIIVIEVNTTPALTPSTVLYHQAIAEKKPVYPTELLEKLIENKRY